MRRRKLSDEELNEVIRLRQSRASWLRIQRETGIHRQTAKRAYEKWERSKSLGELKEARKEVAAQAFREHMESLVILATSFTMHLAVPHLPELMDKDADQFFSWLWEQDILGRFRQPSETTPQPLVDAQVYRHEKELLFESLKVHTRDNVRWKALDEWKEARDRSVIALSRLREKTSKVVSNFVNREQETSLLSSISKEWREDDPVKRMAEEVLKIIWRLILEDKLGEKGPLFATVSQGKGTAQVISVKTKIRDQTVFTFYDSANISLAKAVVRICNLAADNLRKEDMVSSLQRGVRGMENASEGLCEMLNPVKLRPMILRTQCDLCPA